MNVMTRLMNALPVYWENLKWYLKFNNQANGEEETFEEPPTKRRRMDVAEKEILGLTMTSDQEANNKNSNMNRMHRILGHDTSDDFLLSLKDRPIMTQQRNRKKSHLETPTTPNQHDIGNKSVPSGKENVICVSDDEKCEKKEVSEEENASSDLKLIKDMASATAEDSLREENSTWIDMKTSCRFIEGRDINAADKENEIEVVKVVAPSFLENRTSPSMSSQNIINVASRPLFCSMEKIHGAFSLKRPNSGSLSSSSMENKLPASSSRKLPLLDESVRLNEKEIYSELLQNYTNVPLTKYTSRPERFRRERLLSFSVLPPARKKVHSNVEVVDLTSSSEVFSDGMTSRPLDRKDIASLLNPAPSSQLRKKLEKCHVYDVTWISELSKAYQRKDRENHRRILEEKVKVALASKKSEQMLNEILEERVRLHLRLSDVAVEEGPIPVAEEEVSLPELTPEMEKKIAYVFKSGPGNEVIVDKYNLRITRRDMHTLVGTNWLNDEVINFYMNLLIERGKHDNYPSVYCFNTFFYPKLASQGHASLKRWTRKIDIFSHEMLMIPVHLGVHWCLASISLKEKKVKYYDSMGGANNTCLQNLMKYLRDECMDKKKTKFDTSDWTIENVQDNPQQMNGSDCGMFSCMYAEFLCRRAKINFSQSDMPYFRRKMAYEILTARLLL